jgi:hypothetical protein
MDEDPFDDADQEGAPRPEPTGVGRVDAVLTAVAALEDRPLDEHVGVFEAAHDELRRTLDDPGTGSD